MRSALCGATHAHTHLHHLLEKVEGKLCRFSSWNENVFAHLHPSTHFFLLQLLRSTSPVIGCCKRPHVQDESSHIWNWLWLLLKHVCTVNVPLGWCLFSALHLIWYTGRTKTITREHAWFKRDSLTGLTVDERMHHFVLEEKLEAFLPCREKWSLHVWISSLLRRESAHYCPIHGYIFHHNK